MKHVHVRLRITVSSLINLFSATDWVLKCFHHLSVPRAVALRKWPLFKRISLLLLFQEKQTMPVKIARLKGSLRFAFATRGSLKPFPCIIRDFIGCYKFVRNKALTYKRSIISLELLKLYLNMQINLHRYNKNTM